MQIIIKLGLVLLCAFALAPVAFGGSMQCDKHDAHGKGTFNGYACTVDCSGHKAGYAWGEKKGIASPDDCGGKSNSFTEGCKAWAKKNADNAPKPHSHNNDE